MKLKIFALVFAASALSLVLCFGLFISLTNASQRDAIGESTVSNTELSDNSLSAANSNEDVNLIDTENLVLESSSEKESLDLIQIYPSDKSYYLQYAKFASKRDEKGITVFADGSKINFEKYDNVQPFLENGRTLLPLRGVTEPLGADLQWDALNKVITITYQKNTIILKLYSTEAIVNGVKTTLDVPAKLINGRTLVPIRFVSENFNKKVDWIPYSENLKIIYIY